MGRFESLMGSSPATSFDDLDDRTGTEMEEIKEKLPPEEVMGRAFATEDAYVNTILKAADDAVESNDLSAGDTVVVNLDSPPPEFVDLDVRLRIEAKSHGMMPLEIGERAVRLALIG